MTQKVAILGASPNPERYSHKALVALKDHGHEVILVNGKYQEIDGHSVHSNLSELSDVDTLTVYVNEKISSLLESEIKALKPQRVIFNPGSENSSLTSKLKASGINVEEACTLVLLSTDQFDN